MFGKDYQKECNIYIIRSINNEMVLQEVKKSTLSIFDDKRCYINIIESIPRNSNIWKKIRDHKWKISKTFCCI